MFFGMPYHDQNAMKKPNHEKKNTRPYLFMGLRTGIDLAHSLLTEKGMMSGVDVLQALGGETRLAHRPR
jgi:tRNA1(Val) A37 N6-methylase TrmN6